MQLINRKLDSRYDTRQIRVAVASYPPLKFFQSCHSLLGPIRKTMLGRRLTKREKDREREERKKEEEGDDRRNPGIYWPKRSRSFANVNPQKLLRIFFSLALVDPLFFAARWPLCQIKKIKIKRKSKAERMYEVAG